jgi:signal transduction histidine kinase
MNESGVPSVPVDEASAWRRFGDTARRETSTRVRWMLVFGALTVVAFSIFVLFEVQAPRVRALRLLANAALFLTLLGLRAALQRDRAQRRVFPLLFALCVPVIVGEGILFGYQSVLPDRIALHLLTLLALAMAGIQWFWPWQLAAGFAAVAVYAAFIPANHPDFVFHFVALVIFTVLTTAFVHYLVSQRFRQFVTAEQLERISEMYKARSEQFEAKNAEMKDFFYVLSHDLRAPLINLEGFSAELDNAMREFGSRLSKSLESDDDQAIAGSTRQCWGPLNESVAESVYFIRQSVAKMEQLVNGLLLLSRIASRPLYTKPVDIGVIVRDALDALRFKISERGIRFDIGRLPVVVADPMQISQVFTNLIDNAIKYSKPDGDAWVELQCETRGPMHHFSIRDNGIGIRAEDQAKVFRLFSRIQVNGETGEGLGLTAVRKIVERHGGAIHVDAGYTALGRGTQLEFTLPATS